MDKAYETRRLFLKSKCKTFTLQKELRNLDFGMIGEREVLKKIYDHYVDKYWQYKYLENSYFVYDYK